MDGQKQQQQLNGVVQNGKYLADYQSLVNHVAEVHIGHGAINIMKRKQGTNGAFAPPPPPNGGGFPSNMRFGIGTPSAEQFEKFLEDRQKSDRARMEEKRIWRLEHAYRTELCRFLQREGYCPFGKECRFAHDEHELRLRREHPKYKTTLCRNFTTNGYCLYGVRCQFIHQSPPERDETQQPPKLISRPPFAFSAIEAQPNGTTGMKLGPKSVYAHSFSGFSGANGFASSSATPGVVQNGQHKPSGSRSDTVWPNNDVWSNYASGLWN